MKLHLVTICSLLLCVACTTDTLRRSQYPDAAISSSAISSNSVASSISAYTIKKNVIVQNNPLYSPQIPTSYVYRRLPDTPFLMPVPAETLIEDGAFVYNKFDASKGFTLGIVKKAETDLSLSQYLFSLPFTWDDIHHAPQSECTIGVVRRVGTVDIGEYYRTCFPDCREFIIKYGNAIYHVRDGCDIVDDGRKLEDIAVYNVKIAK